MYVSRRDLFLPGRSRDNRPVNYFLPVCLRKKEEEKIVFRETVLVDK